RWLKRAGCDAEGSEPRGGGKAAAAGGRAAVSLVGGAGGYGPACLRRLEARGAAAGDGPRGHRGRGGALPAGAPQAEGAEWRGVSGREDEAGGGRQHRRG